MSRLLHLATFNAENCSLLLDRDYSLEEFRRLDDDCIQDMNHSIYFPNKNLEKLQTIGQMIRKGNFDLVGLMEIGGLETLRNINRYFLDGAYDCFLHEENSRRGIFVGALVKKGRFPRVRGKNLAGRFSRNLLHLEILVPGGPGGIWPRELSVYLVHLKSHYGKDDGIEMRRREIGALCTELPERHGVVMGDFNGLAIPGLAQFEFAPLLALPYRDVLEDRKVPLEDRATHWWFGPQPHFNQLDYIFCSQDIKVEAASVLTPFIPATWAERQWLPSDHGMLEAWIRV